MKSETEYNFYQNFKIFSINNNINPTVDILIESIDRFSFGEESEDESKQKKQEQEEKIKKSAPNNYSFIKIDNPATTGDTNAQPEKLNNMNDIINKILDIKIINDVDDAHNNKKINDNKSKGKICGLFSKEDFDVKIENKYGHKNNQLNDSFEKRYHNPLKNFLDEEDEEGDDSNRNPSPRKMYDYPQKKNEKIETNNSNLND